MNDGGLPERVIRELSVAIGPRLGGSDASHRARDYLAELLEGLGLAVRLDRFSYLGWEYEQAPSIELLSPVAESLACAPAAFSQASDGLIAGKVWLDGKVAAIPDLFEFTRLSVGEGGERRASLLVPPLAGPAFPLPRVQRTFAEPTVYITKDDGDRIASLLEEGEVTVRLETFGRHVPMTDWNVLGKLEGDSEETIVVGSHYDSAWKCPGAVDNASGVGAMAEVARRTRKRDRRRHTFEFVSFAAEEWWLFGSEHFADELVRTGAIGRYKGMVNCDPLGPGETLEVWVGPEFLRGLVDQILVELGVHGRHPVVYREPKTGSDHYPFWERGVPVCFPIFMPPMPEYHQPTDTMDVFQPAKLETIVEIVDAVTQALDRQPS